MDGVENTSNATNGRTPVISTSCRRRLGVVRRALSASSNGMAGSGGLTLHIANAQADRGSVTPTRDHRGETVGGAARLAPGIRRAWPGYKLHEKEAFLFIDESAIETMEGCAQGVATAQKLPVGNLLPIGDEPWEAGWYAGTYFNVMFDEDEGIFKMWYNVSRKLSEQRAESEDALAYATSLDGLHWEKPLLHLHEVDGSSANNLVFPFLRWSTGTGVLKDRVEADPARRYKMLFMFSTAEMSFAGISQPVCIAYSADGVRWSVPKDWINPVISSGTDTQLCFHYDARLRRYVVYLRGRPNVRVITMAESEDCVEWTERELIVAPDEEDPPQDHEFYGMSSLQYRDWRIGFLSVFHVLYESWVAQNPDGANNTGLDQEDEWMNTMDIQLVYSADGRRYHRAGNREPILRVGAPRTADAGSVYPPNAPFEKDGEVWLYYSYGNELHGNAPRHGMAVQQGIGLAKIRRDRLVCIKQSDNAAVSGEEAVLTTVPLTIHPASLRLNLDACTPGASCSVELCDPFGRPIPGFERSNCAPMTGVDSIEQPVRWLDVTGQALEGEAAGQELEEKMVSQSRGTVKLRVFLSGGAKLFAVYT